MRAEGDGGEPTDGFSSDGDGGGPTPEFAVLFPPASALTNEDTITVRGTAPPGAQAVIVAGVAATGTGGLNEWSAEIPLVPGVNEVGVDLIDASGIRRVSVATLAIECNEIVAYPRWVAYDSSGDRAFTAQSGVIVEHDLITGQRRIASSSLSLVPSVGSGPRFDTFINGIEWDATMNRLLVLDNRQLLSVDVAVGDRTLIADASTGSGDWPTLSIDRGDLAVDGDRVLVGGQGNVFAIALSTGDRTELSGYNIGAGDSLGIIDGIIHDATNNRAYVDSAGEIVQVDLSNGNRTLLTDLFIAGNGMAADFVNNRIFVSVGNGFRVVDLAGGAATTVPDPGSVTPHLPRGIRYDGSSLLAADGSVMGVVAVDPTTGARSYPSALFKGDGDPHLTFFGLAALHGNALVTARAGGLPLWGGVPYVAVDLETGARTVVADMNFGAGPLHTAKDFEIFDDHAFIAGLVDGTEPAIIRLDLTTGNRVIVSADNDGGANPFTDPPSDVTRSLDGSSIWVSVNHPDSTSTILAVDPSDGNRVVVSDAVTGSGPELLQVCDLLVADDGLLVLSSGGLLRVDPTTGDRVLVSGDTLGDGPTFGICSASQTGESYLSPTGITLYTVTQGQYVMAINLLSGDRADVSSSSTGRGPGVPFSLVGTPDGRLWAVDVHSGVIAIDPVTGERALVSR